MGILAIDGIEGFTGKNVGILGRIGIEIYFPVLRSYLAIGTPNLL
ncbi:MAG: hypothetical protein ACOYIG_07270 [Acetivibrionales bacterium]|jgi:hypothetical protein